MKSLSLLEDGWDGDKAPAPSQIAVDLSYLITNLAYQLGRGADRVAPDVEGGVATYFFGGDRLDDGGYSLQIVLLASNEGDVVLYVRDRSKAGAEISDVEPTEEGIRAALAQIKMLLVGSC